MSNGVEKCTKTGHDRIVRLLAPVAQDLREWRMASGRPRDDEFVVPMQDGRPWSAAKYRNWCDRIFDPALERAGLPKVRVYDARHACASLLIAAGRNPAFIAKQLGHSIGTLLSVYSHVVDECEEKPPIDPIEEIVKARPASERAERSA